MENLLDTIFPPKCLFCKNSKGAVFCPECLKKCQVLENNTYFIFLRKLNRRLEVFSPFDYDGYVRQCIKYAKYGGKQFASLKILSSFGINFTFNMKQEYEGFEIIPIPLNIRKYRSRGFNQAEVISKILADKYKLPLNNKILQRTKTTETQFKFNREQRYLNMKNAFETCKDGAKGKKLLIVDDICTSGATLVEASTALYEAGAEVIKAFTLSRRL